MSSKNFLSPIKLLALTCAGVLAACAAEPMGPTVQVFPAPNEPFEVFQNDQAVCKQYANQQVAGQAENANNRGVGEAVLTTALGAGLGAAVGGGRGAAIGAGAGGIAGADIGANSSGRADRSIQHQYNMAYSQCMYSKGNQVVGYRQPVYAQPPQGYYPPPDQQGYPQQPGYPPQPAYVPPPGYPSPPPPPPPPGYPYPPQ